MDNLKKAKKTVLEAALKMEAKGLVVGTSGNVSLRIQGRELLAITPTSRHYDTLAVEDIPIVDFNGKIVEGKLAPSAETPLHIGIYKARQNIGALIHTHSVYASAMSVAGKDIPPILEDQVAFLGGEIKTAGYALSGTPELVKNVISALEDRTAVLLPNHGAVAAGRTMRDAFNAAELMEKTAKIYLLALMAGKVNLVPPEALKYYRYYFQKQQSV